MGIQEELLFNLRYLACVRTDIAMYLSERLDMQIKMDEWLTNRPDFPEYMEMKNQYDVLGAKLNNSEEIRAQIETIIKDLEVRMRIEHPEQELPAGAIVKGFNVAKVLNDKEAKVWLANNVPSALTINQAALKKAIEGLEVGFATIEKELRGQIASDLSEYLKLDGETSQDNQSEDAEQLPF